MSKILEKPLSSFKVKDEEFVVISKKEFLRLKRDYKKAENEFTKLYTEIDEEWTWETIDFWPNWVEAEDFINHLRS